MFAKFYFNHDKCKIVYSWEQIARTNICHVSCTWGNWRHVSNDTWVYSIACLINIIFQLNRRSRFMDWQMNLYLYRRQSYCCGKVSQMFGAMYHQSFNYETLRSTQIHWFYFRFPNVSSVAYPIMTCSCHDHQCQIILDFEFSKDKD